MTHEHKLDMQETRSYFFWQRHHFGSQLSFPRQARRTHEGIQRRPGQRARPVRQKLISECSAALPESQSKASHADARCSQIGGALPMVGSPCSFFNLREDSPPPPAHFPTRRLAVRGSERAALSSGMRAKFFFLAMGGPVDPVGPGLMRDVGVDA